MNQEKLKYTLTLAVIPSHSQHRQKCTHTHCLSAPAALRQHFPADSIHIKAIGAVTGKLGMMGQLGIEEKAGFRTTVGLFVPFQIP